MSNRIGIVSIGMMTAVGLDAPSACAAIRARLDGFQETRFVGYRGARIIGAPVPLPEATRGEDRMIHLVAGAIREALGRARSEGGGVPILLCLPEDKRPGHPINDKDAFLQAVHRACGLDVHALSGIFAYGRPSGLVALGQARKLIAARDARHVIVAGVDSYLNSRTIGDFVAAKRLLIPENPDGFLPGEAGSAFLCGAANEAPLHVTGLGFARERAHPYNAQGLPLRGDGMTSAYAAALDQAGLTLAQIEYRVSDLIGEHYFFKQTALAHLRLERGRSDFQDLLSPSESVGNIGAAVVPVMVGMVYAAILKQYRTASPILIEASGDDGECGAAVFAAGKG
jgi:3-oxoacyl-[acyl-carrier-protein] synthase I